MCFENPVENDEFEGLFFGNNNKIEGLFLFAFNSVLYHSQIDQNNNNNNKIKIQCCKGHSKRASLQDLSW